MSLLCMLFLYHFLVLCTLAVKQIHRIFIIYYTVFIIILYACTIYCVILYYIIYFLSHTILYCAILYCMC